MASGRTDAPLVPVVNPLGGRPQGSTLEASRKHKKVKETIMVSAVKAYSERKAAAAEGGASAMDAIFVVKYQKANPDAGLHKAENQPEKRSVYNRALRHAADPTHHRLIVEGSLGPAPILAPLEPLLLRGRRRRAWWTGRRRPMPGRASAGNVNLGALNLTGLRLVRTSAKAKREGAARRCQGMEVPDGEMMLADLGEDGAALVRCVDGVKATGGAMFATAGDKDGIEVTAGSDRAVAERIAKDQGDKARKAAADARLRADVADTDAGRAAAAAGREGKGKGSGKGRDPRR